MIESAAQIRLTMVCLAGDHRMPLSLAHSLPYNQFMAKQPSVRRVDYDVIEPIGKRIVIRKDDNRRETKTGIVLPDSHEIPVITGRVIAISKQIENDDDLTIRQYDKVLFDPREAIPVELEHDNKMFVVALERVLAIFRRSDQKPSSETNAADADETES